MSQQPALFDLPEVPFITARSSERFPSLAEGASCPWHEACTPMDCTFFRRTPDADWIMARLDELTRRRG
jgi:hypothetical protein